MTRFKDNGLRDQLEPCDSPSSSSHHQGGAGQEDVEYEDHTSPAVIAGCSPQAAAEPRRRARTKVKFISPGFHSALHVTDSVGSVEEALNSSSKDNSSSKGKAFTKGRLTQSEILETIVTESDYPFCILPPFFFDRALHHAKVTSLEVRTTQSSLHAAPKPARPNEHRALLTVETWDGRGILQVEGD